MMSKGCRSVRVRGRRQGVLGGSGTCLRALRAAGDGIGIRNAHRNQQVEVASLRPVETMLV